MISRVRAGDQALLSAKQLFLALFHLTLGDITGGTNKRLIVAVKVSTKTDEDHVPAVLQSASVHRRGRSTRTLAVSNISVRYTDVMGKVEKIEREIQDLSPDEMTELREWFAAFDGEAWDRQFEADVHAGKLDALADAALKAHESGRTTKF